MLYDFTFFTLTYRVFVRCPKFALTPVIAEMQIALWWVVYKMLPREKVLISSQS